MGQYLARNRYSRQFVEHYLAPMGAAIWSAPPERFLQFPARFIIGFFANHGLLTVRGHPRWKTVEGGAARYVETLSRPFADRIRLNCPVVSVRRFSDRVAIRWQDGGPEDFIREGAVSPPSAWNAWQSVRSRDRCEEAAYPVRLRATRSCNRQACGS